VGELVSSANDSTTGMRTRGAVRAITVPGSLRRLVKQLSDPVIGIEPASERVVLWNPAAERLLGYAADEALGLPAEAVLPRRFWTISGPSRAQAIGRSGEAIVVDLAPVDMDDGSPAGGLLLVVLREVEQPSSGEQAGVLARPREQRLRQLEALYRADEALHRSLHVDQVLQALVDTAAEILQADKAQVRVWDTEREQSQVRAARGLSPETIASCGPPSAELRASPGDLITIEDVLADPRVSPDFRTAYERECICSTLTAPIVIAGRPSGAFELSTCQPRAFTQDEQRLFRALAQRASQAIDNARLYEQAQQAAALEERQRLARELHDAVTQTLFSASMIAEVLPGLWQRNAEQAERRLEELRRLTRGALAEMRALLVELRPGALVDISLPDLLRQLAEATMSHGRLTVEVLVSGERSLPADVQVVLYRTAQEVLNNVLKHARAERAEVRLQCEPDAVELRISDDGCGFDPAAIPAGHFGVSIMRERAVSIGAALVLESRPGFGTRITLTWPSPGCRGGEGAQRAINA
jgi:signal transduction histidine kinase